MLSHRRFIHQSLSSDLLQGGFGPCRVADLTVIPAEIVLRTVSMQVLFAHLMVDPIMAAFDQTKERFGIVGMDRQARFWVNALVLFATVVNGFVSAVEVLANATIDIQFVSDYDRVRLDLLLNLFVDGSTVNTFNGHRLRIAVPFNQHDIPIGHRVASTGSDRALRAA